MALGSKMQLCQKLGQCILFSLKLPFSILFTLDTELQNDFDENMESLVITSLQHSKNACSFVNKGLVVEHRNKRIAEELGIPLDYLYDKADNIIPSVNTLINNYAEKTSSIDTFIGSLNRAYEDALVEKKCELSNKISMESSDKMDHRISVINRNVDHFDLQLRYITDQLEKLYAKKRLHKATFLRAAFEYFENPEKSIKSERQFVTVYENLAASNIDSKLEQERENHLYQTALGIEIQETPGVSSADREPLITG